MLEVMLVRLPVTLSQMFCSPSEIMQCYSGVKNGQKIRLYQAKKLGKFKNSKLWGMCVWGVGGEGVQSEINSNLPLGNFYGILIF